MRLWVFILLFCGIILYSVTAENWEENEGLHTV